MSIKRDPCLVSRRSRATDAADLSRLAQLATVTSCAPSAALFPWRTESDFLTLIEGSVICITATSTITGKVAGFVCLDDIPHITSIPGDAWEHTLERGENQDGDEAGAHIAPYNTLWLKALLAPPSSAFRVNGIAPDDAKAFKLERELLLFAYKEEDVIVELLSTVLTNLPQTMHVLVAFPSGCVYPPIEGFGTKIVPLVGCRFEGSFLHIMASNLVPRLQFRLGIMEDYDDFVPHLLSGYGLITALPEEFYLDEVLKDQDTFHKVITAEDAVTHRMVGLMCLEASIETQQMVSRQYMTEVFGKLRPLSGRWGDFKSNTFDTPNVVKINFFQLDPNYSLCADHFLPFVFQEFPYVEYVMIILPHEQEEPPFLRQFEYIPLRRYHPRSAKGETIPTPEGLWITCRYAVDPVAVLPVSRSEDVGRISSFLEESFSEFSQQHVAALLEDIGISHSGDSSLQDRRSRISVSFILESPLGGTGEPAVVGVASARPIALHEMYALRANYDVDAFVNYYTDGPRDYTATEIHLSAEEGRRKFFRQEMQGILVRSFFTKPVYRRHIPFFVREMLRHMHVEMALVLEDGQAPPFAPLLRQLLRAPPRRVQEKKHMAFGELKSESLGMIEGEDVMALACLFVGTRRILGDRKKLIHTRIVVVGAGSTGLTCIHRFLSVPYVHFTNLVLVSVDGLPAHPNQQSYMWSADHMELLEREHMSLVVGNPIRVVYGSVVDVDTTQKYVTIDDGSYEPYDYVILTTGRQYVVPQSICHLHQSVQPPTLHSQRGFVPEGTLALDGESSMEKLRQHLHDLDQNPNNISNIVVYGSGLDAFAVVTSIAKLGFSPQQIILVSPETSNPFLDKDAFDCIVKMYNSLGINTLRGYGVTRLEYDDDGGALITVVVSPVSVSEEGDNEGFTAGISNSVELDCSLIVCCEDKDINSHVLSTLNRRSIVFDGRVIVEANYRTIDKCVYAAGPVAMFTRRYGTTPGFDDFNTRDVGTSLAEVLLGVFGLEEFADQSHTDVEDKEEELVAAHNQLYTRVLRENGSRRTDFLMGTVPVSMDDDRKSITSLQKKLPSYASPVTSRIRLPGSYLFFYCRSVDFNPARCLRLCYSNIKESTPIVTGIVELNPMLGPTDNAEATQMPEQSLFVIYVDEQTHFIEAVVYFGNGSPELYHYMCLVGMPQSLLNLLYRYEEARVVSSDAARGRSNSNDEGHSADGDSNAGGLNLMEYLRSPKLQILFYDRFTVFYMGLREKMRTHKALMEVKSRALVFVSRQSQLTTEKRNELLKELTAESSAFARQVQYELLKFMHENKDYLPQIYYLPDIHAHVQQNARTPSPSPSPGNSTEVV
ncbi:hypothetical protein TraAM80_08068 [Trypanosoma rangeli]|uniref:Cilia- and flagella-associated protein 61 N-terminal domain-containing protein n=1 Tax=Trypanosoma rangeli TaxID=5698 RepID=A0A3R7LLY9_TRYRA|nr:uncharacterized protein TraAM80_08068 [Trypanosoma rangeli]RNE99686.1 hypothetical protein TraAM80_08068 [Trypanosoma rangeli]|eukprot:RNE99686.1 hypothetical protein TraAM80_08068 [Trypanosoma rangeli]